MSPTAVRPASLFLITGFLGSGKTTVLNGILRSLSGRRVGVIVNEWGKIAVDGKLLLDPSGLGVVELAGGQIFCSCVSGSFIAAAVKLAALGLDYLLVETSGLAKPAVLETIVPEAERRAAGTLLYKGMICVIDATRFALIRQAAAVVDEQAVYSDRFVMTKTDLADAVSIATVRTILDGLRPGARMTEVVRGAVDASLLEDVVRAPAPKSDPRFRGWGASGRPGTTSVVPLEPVNKESLAAFLRELVPETFRVKGFVRITGVTGLVLVDCVGENIDIRDDQDALRGAPDTDEELGIALIWKGSPPDAASGVKRAAEKVSRAWDRLVGSAARIW
ncbi:MAG: GTP-binding protein [Treponemataceae bacterium]